MNHLPHFGSTAPEITSTKTAFPRLKATPMGFTEHHAYTSLPDASARTAPRHLVIITVGMVLHREAWPLSTLHHEMTAG